MSPDERPCTFWLPQTRRLVFLILPAFLLTVVPVLLTTLRSIA